MTQGSKLFALASAAVAAVVAPPALAQSSASATANGTGAIVAPITLTKTSDLLFGAIMKPTSGNATITMGAGADTVSVSGVGAGASGSPSRAKFTVGGEGGQTYVITIPASFILSNGASNLTVNLASSASTGALSGALGSAGAQTFQVGGAFTIPSTQPAGAYSGSFTATAAYN